MILDGLAVSGMGCVVLLGEETGCDPLPYLKVKKSRKFMGRQDDMAVVATGRALACAGLAETAQGERTGLYLAVGYIPFEARDIDPVLQASLDADGGFDMRRFAAEGYQRGNPLLTFRCLPNMPAYHISANFDVQGPYVVLYPGVGQAYQALEEAAAALHANEIDRALVVGVAHQRNFLVEHQLRRLAPAGTEPDLAALGDAAGCLVLERAGDAALRGARDRARSLSFALGYAQDPAPLFDPLGAASLPVALSQAAAGVLIHEARHGDGLWAQSRWEVA